jgi:hypothetical protein
MGGALLATCIARGTNYKFIARVSWQKRILDALAQAT